MIFCPFARAEPLVLIAGINLLLCPPLCSLFIGLVCEALLGPAGPAGWTRASGMERTDEKLQPWNHPVTSPVIHCSTNGPMEVKHISDHYETSILDVVGR